MTKFSHSIVLFSGDDGLPLEFNVRNTNEKTLLKAIIEHGGGLCSQSDNAVHLMSPGTKVLNADLGKKLVSTRYIFDCVERNYLLDVNDYVFTISEAQTSDISDEDSERMIGKKPSGLINEMHTTLDDSLNLDSSAKHEKLDYNSSNSTTSKQSSMQQKSTTISNLSESFIEDSQDVSHNPRIAAGANIHAVECVPLTSTAKEQDSMDIPDNYDHIEKDLSPIMGSASLVSPRKRKREIPENELKNSPKQLVLNDDSSVEIESDPNESLLNLASPQKKRGRFLHYNRNDDSEDELQIIPNVPEFPAKASPIHTVVSSSQPGMELDQFDNLLLNKAQQKAEVDDEDNLSQSYTVSSSADAQKHNNSAEINSAEMFGTGPSSRIPDSPNQGAVSQQDQTSELQSYIQNLEAEVKKILQKPSPKSIQDKIFLVKYVCCVKKLSPSSVLKSLHQL